jgi:hypothetical protein
MERSGMNMRRWTIGTGALIEAKGVKRTEQIFVAWLTVLFCPEDAGITFL